MRAARRGSAVAVAVALLAVAAGCGSGDDSSAGPGGASTTTNPQLSGEPIVVMNISELTAGIAAPEIPEGLEAGISAINASGGVGGRPVELEVCATRNDPNTAAECGRRAVELGAVALLGNFTFHSAEFMPLMVDEQIPSIGLVTLTTTDTVSEAAYPTDGGIVSAAAGLGYTLGERPYEHVAVVRLDIPDAEVIAPFANQGLAHFDQEVVADVPVPEGAADMEPYVAAAREAGADAVIVGMEGADATNFAVAWREAEPDAGLAMLATDLEALLDAIGDVDDILTAGAYLEDPDLLAIAEYRERLDAVGVDEVGDFRDDVYVATLVFEQIATTVDGELTGPSLTAALDRASGVRTGFTPPISFTPESAGHGGVPRLFNPCVAIYEGDETDGAFVDPFAGEACPAP